MKRTFLASPRRQRPGLRPSALVVYILLAGCSSRNPRPVFVAPTPTVKSVVDIPRGTAEEHTLTAYKSYYEQFRHISNLDSTVSVRQEAKLLEDYANAREAFNYWLWFVTDTVKNQSTLEPPGSNVEPAKHPTQAHFVGEYRSRARDALSAIRAFDTDLRDILHVYKPSELSSPPVGPYSLGYSIVAAFGHLGPDNAQIAGDDLMKSYSWDK